MNTNNEKEYIEINPMGNTQREQWKTVVSMIDWKTDFEAHELCEEIKRYIDFCEDAFDKLRAESENGN